MAVSEKSGGSQTAVIDTEHTLATITAAGTYILGVDMSNLVDGDELELRIYVKMRSASASDCIYNQAYAHKQGDGAAANAKGTVVKVSVPVPAPFQFIATLKQTAGTGRAFDWSIYEL